MIPIKAPKKSATKIAAAPSLSETGKPLMINSVTLKSRYWKEGPKSPRKMSPI